MLYRSPIPDIVGSVCLASSLLPETMAAPPVQVMSVAKDQNGCRFLQRKFDEGGPAAIQAVLPEVLEHLIDLMMDPFGNYLIQKLLDRCSEEQRLAVRALPKIS